MKAILTFMALILLTGCDKGWLEERADKSIVVPSTLADLQALLDNSGYMNGNNLISGVLPDMGENATDDYYLKEAVWNTMFIPYKNSYVWNKDIFEGVSISDDWNRPYKVVFYANTVLDIMEGMTPNDSEKIEYDNIKGSALFHRANAFFHLAQVFAKPYDIATADNDLGIPLRLTSDFNINTSRATVTETYGQIIEDLKTAEGLLPDQPLYKTRPSKAAVYGLNARMYLVMGDYSKALDNAEKCLEIQNSLIDLNTVNVNANLPFVRFGPEVIFDASILSGVALLSHIVSPDLYESYGNNDLRKTAYFRVISGELKFKGSYTRSQYVLFGGLATDEMYLIKSECLARADKIDLAMVTLQTLLESKYTKHNGISTFVPYTPTDKNDALDVIFAERRKELPFRGLRWMDLRRLNLQGKNIVLRRQMGGQEYILEPNSERYTYPIPEYVIIASGIEQNPR